MRWLYKLPLRLRSLFKRRRVEQELSDELRFHLEKLIEENVAKGMTLKEARYAALRELGGVDQIKEECRDARRTRLVEDTVADVKYAVRGFRRTPVFVLTVVATIALPLALNTALFTIFNAYVLRPVPVRDPYSIYRFTWTDRRGAGHSFSWSEFEAFRDSNPAFSEVAGAESLFARVDGHPVLGELVTANYFRMLGVSTVAGRTFLPDEGIHPGSAPVVVLNYEAWQNKLGGDSHIVGKTIVIRGCPLQVIGITKPEFTGLNETARDFWVPITMAGQLEDGPSLFGPERPNRLDIVGRLKAGLTAKQAEAALRVWARHATDEKSREEKAVGIVLVPRATSIPLTPQLIAAALPVLLAFLLVLLIACANIASMMLARAIARQREIGLRLSLGAARLRLVRQLLTESLVLAVPAALAGAVLSKTALQLGQSALFSAMPSDFAQIVTAPSLHFDIRVFGFLIAVAALSAILFGLAPAIQTTCLDVAQVTKGEFIPNLRPTKLRNALVIGQISACAMLLICAGTSLRASARMSKQEVGFATKGVLELDINEKHRPRILSRIAEEPAVQVIAAAQSIPLNGMLPTVPMVVGEGTGVRASYNFVSPNFFRALDIPILSGRNFTEEEAQAGAAVAIVSQNTALRFWPEKQALGQTLRIAPDPSVSMQSDVRHFSAVRIIGVAADIVSCCFTVGMDPSLLYLPTTSSATGTELLVRVHGSSDRVRQTLDTELAAISPGAIDQIHTMETFREAGVFPFQVAASVCTVIAVLALLLASSGVYGVLSYSVSQRTREIGIRMAIGASGSAVVRLVLKQSLRLAVIGSAAGSVLAMGAWRILASRLFFMRAFDGMAFFVGVLVSVVAACLAAYIPARRATKVDPMVALRYE
jgi:predicted permease